MPARRSVAWVFMSGVIGVVGKPGGRSEFPMAGERLQETSGLRLHVNEDGPAPVNAGGGTCCLP